MEETGRPPTKTIGVLGGMGPAATVDFYRRLTASTASARDQDHLHVLIDSLPAVPDRTEFLLGKGADPTPVLVAMARRLERAGAEILVMACNTAGAFTDDVAAAVGVPLVNWVYEVVAAIAARDPAIRRVGLLATSGTAGTGLYQRAFAARQIDVVVPPRPEQESVMLSIYGPLGVKAGSGDLSTAAAIVESAGRRLAEDGADALLLACTELSVLFADHRPRWSVATYDAAQLVAERLIIMAGGRLK